jgi:hypothetical protein
MTENYRGIAESKKLEENTIIREKNEDFEKKIEESPVESNTDSNRSIGNFKDPSSQITSSSRSMGKELSYMTPKSIHNLNLLFTQSNGKKPNFQGRIVNTSQ